MKVTAIISSPSKQGNTAQLAQQVIQGAKDNGAEITTIYLPEPDMYMHM